MDKEEAYKIRNNPEASLELKLHAFSIILWGGAPEVGSEARMKLLAEAIALLCRKMAVDL